MFPHKRAIEYDDYVTPKSIWKTVEKYIPRDKVIWECFYCDGSSGAALRELGFNVIHEDVDFYTHNLGDVIVSNPPFSTKIKAFERLAELDKPFLMIVPSWTMITKYIRRIFKGKKLQLIIPSSRQHFIKVMEDKRTHAGKSASFDTYFLCYKLDLPSDLILLDI